MRLTREQVERRLAGWMRQGISPRRLALTLALGFTIGCVPVMGIPTVICAALALSLGLNLPAIQAANYAAMPFQLALVAPFLRLGARCLRAPFLAFGARPITGPGTLLKIAAHLGSMAGQAMLGWALVAVPAAAVLTMTLTLVLRKIPVISGPEISAGAVQNCEAGD